MDEMAADAADSPAIIVYGRPDGYDTEKTPTATKTSTPLVDVPQAMNVISREQLNDQGDAQQRQHQLGMLLSGQQLAHAQVAVVPEREREVFGGSIEREQFHSVGFPAAILSKNASTSENSRVRFIGGRLCQMRRP